MYVLRYRYVGGLTDFSNPFYSFPLTLTLTQTQTQTQTQTHIVTLWTDTPEYGKPIPSSVLGKIVSPELVVVRAAHKEMSLRDALQMLHPAQEEQEQKEEEEEQEGKTTAYIEYQSLSGYPDLLASLLQDNVHGGGAAGKLYLPKWLAAHALNVESHLWLGDGKTRGKLHYDRPDNILVQFAGSKTFQLLPPDASAVLQEGHMREAQLGIKKHKGKIYSTDAIGAKGSGAQPKKISIYRESLSQSTSLVHSPISILQAQTSHNVQPVTCTVTAGQALFVPSFWWHEVTSAPSKEAYMFSGLSDPDAATGAGEDALKLNLAVNYWFAPLYDKPFPCAECVKKFNYQYLDVSASVASVAAGESTGRPAVGAVGEKNEKGNLRSLEEVLLEHHAKLAMHAEEEEEEGYEEAYEEEYQEGQEQEQWQGQEHEHKHEHEHEHEHEQTQEQEQEDQEDQED